VVGTSLIGAPDNAFLWTPTGGTVALPLPSRCYPAGILVDGTIALTATLPGAQAVGATWHPLWGVRRIALPGGEVHVQDLSTSGGVAGFASFPGSGTHAFRWTSAKGLVDLGTPVGFDISQAYGLNDHGLVVGLSRSALSDQATVWQEGLGPALLAYARSNSTQSAAYAVNAEGWIVGSEYQDPQSYPRSFAVLWVDWVPCELTGLVVQEPGQPPVHVSIAWDVNDQGQIAARGLVGGVLRALRLDPL
jgi:probable HAF family extracellular repeat protein